VIAPTALKDAAIRGTIASLIHTSIGNAARSTARFVWACEQNPRHLRHAGTVQRDQGAGYIPPAGSDRILGDVSESKVKRAIVSKGIFFAGHPKTRREGRRSQPPNTTLFMIRPGASVNKPVTTRARVKIQIIAER
jgi:hypothetical protein